MSHRLLAIRRTLVQLGLTGCVVASLLVGRFDALAAAPAGMSNSAPVVADEHLAEIFGRFDGDDFATRQRALARLSDLLADRQQANALADAAHRLLLNSATSVELRVQLQAVLKQRPDLTPPAPPSDVSPADLTATMNLLSADTERVRLAAEARLQWYLSEPKLAARMLSPLKASLADPLTTRNAQPVLNYLLTTARRRWLVDEALDQELPPVEEPQIRRWIVLVGGPTLDSAADRCRQEAARYELLDLLAREEYREKTTALIRAAISGAVDPEGTARLETLFDWTRPAMVAERWDNGRHTVIQNLLIGVPQVPEGNPRVTQFDRIDDRSAHCLSGNSLQTGDYPVGVAIPHPNSGAGGLDMLFHLVNLPTPRRRMVYEVTVERPESERFAELSRRTVARILADKRRLGELEIGMLAQLEPETVSRFAGDFFAAVPDRALKGNTHGLTGDLTEHDAICIMLARMGTRAAQPALEREAAARQAADSHAAPVALVASLSIARRDPWPAVDDWLADLAAKDVEFVLPKGQHIDLAATAAALLLSRHDAPDDWFDLEQLDEGVLESLGVPAYRFRLPQGRAAFRHWWQEQRTKQPAAASP